MPKRDGGNAADLAERIGSENWATLEDVIREVFKRVGPRVLQWRVAWGIEPLIGLVVLHTCIVTAREMRLGELAEEMKAAAEPTKSASGYQWRIRVDGHPNSGCWIDVMDGDFQNLDVVGRLEFRAKPRVPVEPDGDDVH